MKYILLLLLFAGCMTAKNLPKHNNKFPIAAAEYAAEKFPCLPGDTTHSTTIDSAAFLASIEDLTYSVMWLNSINDSLFNVIANHKDTTHNDTICRKYAPIVEKQKQEINKLKHQLENILPIFITDTFYVPFVDSANNSALRLSLVKEQEGRQKAEQVSAKWEQKAKIRFWMIVALCSLAAARIAWGLKTGKF